MKKVIDTLSEAKNDNLDVQRRRFQRRSTDTCMITVNNHAYPVQDWSMSGVLFEADSRTFDEGENIPMTLKFRIGNEIAEIGLTGNIVRKNARFVATQFDEMDNVTQQTLHRIIDQSSDNYSSTHTSIS